LGVICRGTPRLRLDGNQNFVFERRYSVERPDGYSRAAAELVALEPDIIVSGLGEPAILALRNATTRIPIVMLVSADPVGTGLVANLARPGGNVTGMSILAPALGGKRLAILKEAVPTVSRVAVLWNAAYPGKAAELRDSQATAAALKVTLHFELRCGGRMTSIARSRSSDDTIPMRW
jgi:putative ABC transport system substrate-binding protein